MTVSPVAHKALQESRDLGGGLVATIVISRVEPKEPPATGDDWPEELDHIRVKALVQFPGSESVYQVRYRIPALRVRHKTLEGYDDYDSVESSAYFSGPTLSGAVATALAACEAFIAPVREHHLRRLARITKREAALARALTL